MSDEVHGYGQYCPITRAVEVLGERWSIMIVRDLLLGTNRFNDLARGLPGLSRTLLSKRLRQLQAGGIVEHVGDEYLLTPSGEDLRPVVFGIGEWGARWQFGDPREHELDPELLMWWVHRRLDFSVLPDRRVVLAFQFRDRRERFWIVRDASGPSICTFDPGFDVDVHVDAELPTLYKIWLGRLPLADALRDGLLTFDGPAPLVRRMSQVCLLSPIAEHVAAAQLDVARFASVPS